MLRGTAQNPDVFFQAREACNPFYRAWPTIVQDVMDRFAQRTGRNYHLVRLHRRAGCRARDCPDGLGSGRGRERPLNICSQKGEKLGLVKVRLFRPFPMEAFISALPKTVRSIAVLDRTKEPGSLGEPLYRTSSPL